jgi:hypothetical protein
MSALGQYRILELSKNNQLGFPAALLALENTQLSI